MISLELLFGSGAFAYIILMLMLCELFVISIYHSVTKKGIQPLHALANLGSGAAMILALGFVIDGVAAHWIALLLLISLVAHWLDLGQRWTNARLVASNY